MKKFGFCFFIFAAGLSFFPLFAFAESEAAQLKIISAPQTIGAGATSTVFTVESQDASGTKTNVSTTTYITLSSLSSTGKFASSPADGPCGSSWTISSVTISKNTAHKSFCYKDETAGTYTITVSAPAQPAILPDSQEIIILAPLPLEISTSTSSSTATSTVPSAESQNSVASSTQESLAQSFKVKIFRFLPNPLGDDAGNEWVEIKNQDEKDVLLDGWLLDDKNTGEGPAGDALVLSGVIVPNEIKRFVLPSGAFALNNSGGDEINLYFSDKSLADKVVYEQTAYDDGIFEFREGVWQQPARDSGKSGGSNGGGAAASDFTYLPVPAFKLNEILPNPLGDDAGKEWVEIFNPGTATATLEGYFLANGDSDSWSASAWTVPKGALIPPLGLVVITLPKDVFSLKNAGKEKVKLFSPQKQLLDFVSYENAPENKTWAKNKEGKWGWSIPTFGVLNDQTPELMEIFISEILPQPEGDDEEFVEIASFATTTINLEGAVLRIGSRGKTFEAGAKIEPSGYLAIYEDDLPARMRNSGQTVKLFDAFGRMVAEAAYPKAQAGSSYATIDGKNYVWTSSVTADSANELVLGSEIGASGKETGTAGKDKTNSNASGGSIAAPELKKILKADADIKMQLAQMQETINQLNTQILAQARPSAALAEGQNPSVAAGEEIPPSEKAGSGQQYLVYFIGLGALGALIFLVFKYPKF